MSARRRPRKWTTPARDCSATPKRSSLDDDPDDVRSEVAQLRREMLNGLETVTNNISVLQGTVQADGARFTLATGTRKKNNKLVSKLKFSVPVGQGAEEQDDFAQRWVALLKADGAYSKFLIGFARCIIQSINAYGRDLINSDQCLVLQAIAIAADMGKGALRASRPPPEPARPRPLTTRVPSISRAPRVVRARRSLGLRRGRRRGRGVQRGLRGVERRRVRLLRDRRQACGRVLCGRAAGGTSACDGDLMYGR